MAGVRSAAFGVNSSAVQPQIHSGGSRLCVVTRRVPTLTRRASVVTRRAPTSISRLADRRAQLSAPSDAVAACSRRLRALSGVSDAESTDARRGAVSSFIAHARSRSNAIARGKHALQVRIATRTGIKGSRPHARGERRSEWEVLTMPQPDTPIPSDEMLLTEIARPARRHAAKRMTSGVADDISREVILECLLKIRAWESSVPLPDLSSSGISVKTLRRTLGVAHSTWRRRLPFVPVPSRWWPYHNGTRSPRLTETELEAMLSRTTARACRVQRDTGTNGFERAQTEPRLSATSVMGAEAGLFWTISARSRIPEFPEEPGFATCPAPCGQPARWGWVRELRKRPPKGTFAVSPFQKAQAPTMAKSLALLTDGVGFEPTLRFHVNTLSRRAPSTTRPPVQTRAKCNL